MSSRQQILSLLVDGQFHSGTELGAVLGISRAAISKSVQGLVERGLEIHSVSGKGYRWVSPVQLLDENLINQHFESIKSRHALRLTVLEETESTSSYLLDRIQDLSAGPAVCLAENQTSGRGRRGRQWLATPYQNLALSIAWRFEAGPAQLSGLSIAAGVTLVRVLSRYGISGAQLKWPNDVLHDNRKLAGVLVDLRGEADGPSDIVLGVGLNVRLNPEAAGSVGQPWTDLATISNRSFDRNQLAADLIGELADMLAGFLDSGLQPFLDDWKRWHAFENRAVRLLQAEQEIHGTIRGVDKSGALQLDTGEQILTIHSGEVSLRAD